MVSFTPGIPRHFWFLLLVLWTVEENNHHHSSPFLVTARCMIQDRRGYTLDLNVLPRGIEYDGYTDILTCYEAESCRGLIITGCAMVQCQNKYSCHGTQFVNNEQVICSYTRACQEMQVSQGHIIVCNATEFLKVQKPCLGAMVEIRHSYHDDNLNKDNAQQPGGVLHCVGPGACTSPLHQPLAIRVGAKGTVRCENNVNRYYSCHNVLLEVNHAYRACFDKLHSDKTHQHPATTTDYCAVTCVNDYDCNTETTKFYLPPV
ncbi:hypothetical protein ACA910_007062 [Epithemia clementina (nom. ined.)]